MAENKTCEICKQNFTCQADEIQKCHCSQVKITEEARQKLHLKVSDCICGDCLKKFTERSL